MNDTEYRRLESLVRAVRRPDAQLLTYYILTAFLGVVTLPLLIPLYFRYHTLHYRFEDEGISMGYGILFRREMYVTYARMQDIHLSQNIFERWLGIGTVTVQTAGAGTSGDLEIVGVRTFEAIRDYLYARMRGVHAPVKTSPELALLSQIRDELRSAAATLRKRT